MTKYEMLLVLDAALADDAKESLVKSFEDMVTANGGKVEKTDRWGVRKLQYPINYKSEGYYVLMAFEDVQKVTQCSTGCGGCHQKVLDIISEIMMSPER